MSLEGTAVDLEGCWDEVASGWFGRTFSNHSCATRSTGSMKFLGSNGTQSSFVFVSVSRSILGSSSSASWSSSSSLASFRTREETYQTGFNVISCFTQVKYVPSAQFVLFLRCSWERRMSTGVYQDIMLAHVGDDTLLKDLFLSHFLLHILRVVQLMCAQEIVFCNT